MYADLFYLLALQQVSRGCKRCISPPVPLSRVVPGHTNSVPNFGELILLADGAPQRLAELWYGVEVSATNSTRRSLPPLGLVSKSGCLTSLTPEKQFMTRTLLPTGEVEDSNSPLLMRLELSSPDETRALLS